MSGERVSQGWGEALEAIDLKHSAAHERIRNDLERTTSTLSSVAAAVERNYNYFVGQQAALQLELNKVSALAMRPVDGTTVVWGTKTVIAVIAAVAIGVGMYWDLRQGNKDLRRDLSEATTATARAIAEMKQQREADKKEANDRLTQFLSQRLETSLAVAAATTPKGAKK